MQAGPPILPPSSMTIQDPFQLWAEDMKANKRKAFRKKTFDDDDDGNDGAPLVKEPAVEANAHVKNKIG